MGKVRNEVGNRYGMLTVDHLYGVEKHRGAIWLCKCDCGGDLAAFGVDLRRGNTRSCGCLRRMQYPLRENLGFWHGEGRRKRNEKPSNGDRIRHMTDEELAKNWLGMICPYHDASACIDSRGFSGCTECKLDWLRKESK